MGNALLEERRSISVLISHYCQGTEQQDQKHSNMCDLDTKQSATVRIINGKDGGYGDRAGRRQ